MAQDDGDYFFQMTEIGPEFFDRAFIGRLPMEGDACEIVCVYAGSDRMAFKLRVKTAQTAMRAARGNLVEPTDAF